MNIKEYNRLCKMMCRYDDVYNIAAETGLPEELLFILYTQEVTRDATKRFYVVKNKAPILLKQWKKGTSLLKLAEKLRFPPVLLSQMLMLQDGMPRKTFWKYMRKPEAISESRIRREFIEVLRADMIYSPLGSELQKRRGEEGEEILAKMLNAHGIGFLTEYELRGEYDKTPDFLLIKPIRIDDLMVHWFESKANFGDRVEIKRNMTKQLIPYTEMFGCGVVVYWFGHVDDVAPAKGVKMVDETWMKDFFKEANRDKIQEMMSEENEERSKIKKRKKAEKPEITCAPKPKARSPEKTGGGKPRWRRHSKRRR